MWRERTRERFARAFFRLTLVPTRPWQSVPALFVLVPLVRCGLLEYRVLICGVHSFAELWFGTTEWTRSTNVLTGRTDDLWRCHLEGRHWRFKSQK